MQQAVVNFSGRLRDVDLNFVVEAVNAQVVECAARWGYDPTPVVFYSDVRRLPAQHVRIMSVVDDIDAPGAAGYHTVDLGVVYSKVLAQGVSQTGVTISHEALEEMIDPWCNLWRMLREGRQLAVEVCDMVQQDWYLQPATVLGETRDVLLANYVTPEYFDPLATSGFDRMGLLEAPLTMSPGGYMIVRDVGSSDEELVFARVVATPEASHELGRKMQRPDSRTLRRLRG